MTNENNPSLGKMLERSKELTSGPWESTAPFTNLADPNFVKCFSKAVKTLDINSPENLAGFRAAFDAGRETIRYYLAKRPEQRAYLNSIQQQF